MITDKRHIRHLYWRAGFGLHAAESKNALEKTPEQNIESIFEKNSSHSELSSVEFNGIKLTDIKKLSEDERKDFTKLARKQMSRLNLDWLKKLCDDEAQLQEKMTLFWHGHFACNVDNPLFAQNLNNTLRRNALGNFGTLVLEVSKEPAMLQFLNNKQNKKDAPNENFARELMELFTIGRGNYTEQDVKEAARAFTGWRYDEDGVFELREVQHDFDEKTFMGRTGNFNGEEIISILLEQKQTAKFICSKIWKFFVCDVEDEEKIETLCEGFFNSGYDMEKLMREIFSSEWFYDEKYIGSKIKSPIEFFTGMRRNFTIELDNEETWIILQKILTQVLFRPPNVAGWKGGQSWIDSSTIMARVRLAQIVLGNKDLEMDVKEDFDRDAVTMQEEEKPFQSIGALKVKTDLAQYIEAFDDVDETELLNEIAALHIITPLEKLNVPLIEKHMNSESREDKIRFITMSVMSLPEYQIC